MVPPDPIARRSPIRVTVLLLLILVTASATAGGFVWWTWTHPKEPPLDPNWPVLVTVLAGDGVEGTNDGRTRGRFSDPFGIAVGKDGTVYVADAGIAQRVRAIAPDGRVYTVAGGERGFADGAGESARFNTPSGLAIDANGTLYVADTGNNAIRRITPDGQVSTLAGDGIAGDKDGQGRQARFNGPLGVAADAAGRVIVADTYNDRIRAIDPDGSVRTIAGSLPGTEDGLGQAAQFYTPCGVAVDAADNIHVADTGNGLIRTIDPSGRVTTTAVQWDQLARPVGIALGTSGERYVTGERGRIVAISRDGLVRPLAGGASGFRDGPGMDARFRAPAGIAVAAPGLLVVADSGNALVRLVGTSSSVALRPPPSTRILPRFDAERFGWFPLLWPIAPMEGPHEVAGTIGEARGAEGAERFHAGIDVRADEGTTVFAVRDGVITSPLAANDFGSINESLRVGPMAYVHIRAGRERNGTPFDDPRFVPRYDETGKVAGMRIKRGSRFATGEAIGTINPFNHVHMNVGWPGEEYNPLGFHLLRFEDKVPPTIARGGVRFYDADGQPITERVRGRFVVTGHVRVVVDAWDAANGNRPGRRLGLYDLGFQVLERDGHPAPGYESVRRTLRFNQLTVEPDAAHLVYAEGSGIPFYGRRRTRFLYILTDTFQDGVAAQGFWDTTQLPPGDYIFRVWAADINGNVALANRDLPVTVVAPPALAR